MNAANLAQSVRDRLGRIFDAGKFRVGADGLPRFDALGRFVNLRGGRKKKNAMQQTENASQPAAPDAGSTGAFRIGGGNGSSFAGQSPTPAVNPLPAAPAAAPEPPAPAPEFGDVKKALGSFTPGDDPAPSPAAAADTLADDLANLPENATADTIIGIIQTGLVLIGEEEGVLTAQEKVLLRRPLERVLKKYEIGSNALPAEADLALAVVGLVVVRLQKPKTATFAMKVKAWIMRQFFAAKGERLAATLQREVGAEKGGAS